jgi:iron-sulfur cluster assembly protein
VDGAADLVAEHVVDQLVLLDARHALEPVGHDLGTEVVAAAGEVRLRVGVRGGGCSGFQYALALDEKHDDDHVFDSSGIPVLVDPASLRYVEGSTVDYTENFMGSGFEVSNPNVVSSCGCGSSFRVADEEPSCGASV